MEWAHWREEIGRLYLPDGSAPAAYAISAEVYDDLLRRGFLDHQVPAGGGYYGAPQLLGRVLMDDPDLPKDKIWLMDQSTLDAIVQELQQMRPLSEILASGHVNGKSFSVYPLPIA